MSIGIRALQGQGRGAVPREGELSREEPLWLERPARERILSIFDKIKRGIEPTPVEMTFLHRCSIFTPSIGQRICALCFTPSDAVSVQEMDRLTDRIYSRTISSKRVLEDVEHQLRLHVDPTIKEVAALARIVLSCYSRRGEFRERLERFRREKGREPLRAEWIDLVEDFNREVLPFPSKAGEVTVRADLRAMSSVDEDRLIRVDPLEIAYDREGYLEIRQGAIAPIKTSCRQILSAAQVDEMLEVYDDLIRETAYNTLGETLEFIRYYREEKSRDPEFTLARAFEGYRPDLVAIFDKYRSGTCIQLAEKLCRELERRGIQAQSLARVVANQGSVVPIPGTERDPVKWHAFSEEVRGVDHTAVICLYHDDAGRENVMKFECSFEKELPGEITHYLSTARRSGVKRFLADCASLPGGELPSRVLDYGLIGKLRLKGRHKALMKKDEKIFGVDFLRGNVYINPSWARTLSGIPLNAEGLVSLPIEDLATPDANARYWIDGVETEISHRQALRLLLAKVREAGFILPEDFEENMITLAQCTPLLFTELLLYPLQLIRSLHRDLSYIGRRMKELREVMEDDPVHNMTFYSLRREFEAIIREIYFNRAEEAGEQVARLKARLEGIDIPAPGAMAVGFSE